jgi:Arc/MetJ-type ribon-helix-helix transcriptional regulator
MMRDALRLMKRDREMDEIKLELLRRHLAEGLEQADREDYSDLTAVQIAQRILEEDDE